MSRAALPARFYAIYCVRIVLLGILILLPVLGFGQHYPSLAVPGSPRNIYMMMQDSQSRLWLGTIDEVWCFDGTHFYSLRPYGFPHETPNAFAEDREGGIWIGTQGTDVNGGQLQGGLYRYQNGRVERILGGDILSVVAVGPGTVLASVGTEASGRPAYGDLYRLSLRDGRWTALKVAGSTANHMSVDHQGRVLFPCPNGWCEVAGDEVASWHPGVLPSGYRQHTGDLLAEKVIRDREGCLWFRAEIRASYQCPADSKPQYLPFEISQIDSSAHLEEASDGSVFMLVPLLLGRPGAFHGMDSSELPAALQSALVGQDGTIWLGTPRGLFRMPYPFRLETWGKQDGIIGIQRFFRRIGDRIFTTANRIFSLGPDRRQWVPIPGSDQFRLVNDIESLPGDRILATAWDGAAVYARDGKVLARSAPGTGLGSRLAQSRDGTLWLGGNGISRVQIHGDRITFVPEPVDSDSVTDMRYDAERDILWVCAGRKILFHQNGAWHTLSQKEGLLDATCFTLALGPDGSVWLGYQNAAYAWIENPLSTRPVVHNFTGGLNTLEGGNGVNALGFDGRHQLWLGNTALNVAALEDAQREHWLRVTEEEGVPPVATAGIAFLADTDDSLWYAIDGGIMHFSPPADFATRLPVPTIDVAGFSVGAGAPQLADTFSSFPHNQEVTAHLGSLQFDRRAAMQIRYRLLPEQGWRTASSMNLALGKLSWGEHSLEVQARIAAGSWSAIAEKTIRVVKPVWLLWPVLICYVVAAGGLVEAARRWRKKRRASDAMMFPELAEWRLAALSPELHELNGTLLDGRFEVGRILARGGFATVAEGRDLHQDSRRCAIKIFRQELVDKDWMARRFKQEVRALEQIRHPNVVRIYGSGTMANGALYLVMEFIEGTTLRELLEIGKLPPLRAAECLLQAGSALDEIHSLGICHRDLKPENLMIRSFAGGPDELVLIDFSIAIVKDPDETLHGLSRAAGTIYYMAPEQAVGYADSSTDIYSLAKILIEMLTGQRLSILLPDASIDLPDRVRELLQRLPLPFSSASIELICGALEFDPSRRPKSAGAFAGRIAKDLQADLIRR
jgi:tRNA A-37 threonylcarbamoyl transferase component Bud32